MLTLQNGTVLQFSTAVKNLGVLIDSQLTMVDHIAAVCRSGFFQLWQLRSIRQSLTLAAVKTLIPAFISSRLDYCNQLFVSVIGRLLDKLQLLQNAAARLVTGTRKFDRITPVMRELHWLPVRQRIRFKIAILVFEHLHGLAPAYLSEYCKLTTSLHICDRPMHACCLFCAHGQPTWRQVTSWRRHRKTFLFNCLDS